MSLAVWVGARLTGAAAPCSLCAWERPWVESTHVAGCTVGLREPGCLPQTPVAQPSPPDWEGCWLWPQPPPSCGSWREHSVAMERGLLRLSPPSKDHGTHRPAPGVPHARPSPEPPGGKQHPAVRAESPSPEGAVPGWSCGTGFHTALLMIMSPSPLPCD